MELALTVAVTRGRDVTVLVDVADGTRVADLRAELGRALGEPGDGLYLLSAGGSRLDDATEVAASALRQGSVIALTALPAGALTPPAVPPAAAHGWSLHVVGGPDAGTVLPLPTGSHELGRGLGGLHDASLSRQHLRLDVTPAGATVVDLHSTNGTTLEGVAVPVEGEGDPLPLALGQVVAAGDSLLVVAAAVTADAAVHPGAEGSVEFTRPPRLLPGGGPERIPLPVEPTEPTPRRIPIAAMVAPLVLGGVVAFLFSQPVYLLFARTSCCCGWAPPTGPRGWSSGPRGRGRRRCRWVRARFMPSRSPCP